MTTKNIPMPCVPRRMRRITVISRIRIWYRSCISDEWIAEDKAHAEPEFQSEKAGNVIKKNLIFRIMISVSSRVQKRLADLFEATDGNLQQAKESHPTG